MVLQPDYAHSAMNASNETQAHTLTATDNLILVLLAVRAFLEGAGILRRKKYLLKLHGPKANSSVRKKYQIKDNQ